MNQTIPNAVELYLQKLESIRSLLRIQDRQLEILEHGDAEGAAILEQEAHSIVESCKAIDLQMEKIPEDTPASGELISIEDELFEKMEEARSNHEIIHEALVAAKKEMQKELNLTEAKLQLQKGFLETSPSWKKNFC